MKGRPEKRNVIFVPFITTFGGVERLVLQLSHYLHHNAVSHTILTFSNSVNLARFAHWPIVIVELSGKRNTLSEMRSLREWIGHARRDESIVSPVLVFDLRGTFYASMMGEPFIAHITDPPTMLPADTSKLAFTARRRLGAQAPASVGLLKTMRSEVVHRLNSAGVRRAKRVVVMTRRIANEIRALYDVDAQVIRPGITAPLATEVRHHQQALTFLSISRLVGTKHVDWILRVLGEMEKTVWKGNADWQLLIAGDGPDRLYLADLAERIGVSEHTRWLGFVDEERLDGLYEAASIFLMPAAQGWGLPAMEALARRVPVVMSAASGISEILGGSPWVEIAEVQTEESFARAFRIMLGRLATLSQDPNGPPALVRADEWAAEICDACSWTVADASGEPHFA